MSARELLLLLRYNKDVVCVLDEGKAPVCEAKPQSARRTLPVSDKLPSHDPYIPRKNAVFYNCSGAVECNKLELQSLTQLTSPTLRLKSCFPTNDEAYQCETVRYNYFKNIDKLLFLSNNIKNKTFYEVDCLLYSNQERVCHRKDADSHAKLMDIGNLARPQERSILSQDEYICEENELRQVNCDLDAYVPFNTRLEWKLTSKVIGDVLLKSGTYLIPLKYGCSDDWCGFTGEVTKTRRSQYNYNVPGGSIYRCYYANRQQICKEIWNKQEHMFRQREWAVGPKIEY